MSVKRLYYLFYKDLTLFFLGRRKIRRKAEVLYFIAVFIVSFFMAALYLRMRFKTVLFSLSTIFFLYLLMSFIFDLKHFIFFEEDIKIISRLPVPQNEYYISKGLLIVLFGLLFTFAVTSGNLLGAAFLVNKSIPVFHLFFSLLFNTFFSMAFSMLLYALLLRIFKRSDSRDVVTKVQIALGVVFGLIFAMAPSLAPLLDLIDAGDVYSVWYFKLLPFTWFVNLDNGILSIVISILYVVMPFVLAVLLGFDEKGYNKEEKVREFSRVPFVKNRKKIAIFSLILTHLLRSKITKRTLISPVIINVVVLLLWSFKMNGLDIVFFGVWTLVFMSVIASLALFISDSYRAFWILQRAPLKNGAIVATAIDAGFLFIIMPYALFVLFVFLLKGISLRLIIISELYGLTASYLFLHILFYVRPSMIFSRAGFERGINSLKELIVSFVLVPLVAGGFNLMYKFHSLCPIKLSILIFLSLGYFINLRLSRKSFIFSK